MAIAYSEAVRRSKKLIQSGLREELAQHASGEFMAVTMGVSMLRYETSRLLAWAETHAGGFDVLRLGVAHALEQGEELPPEVLQWLVRYLRGEVTRPIWIAVSGRVLDGMKATRNDASEAISACDAVADSLAELKLEPATFYGVKRIWLRFEKNKGTAVEAT
jgi:hypothetical protein